MFLKRAILVNWGNIPNIELDLGPVNLFSGGNGSGKTTAADAIQALMTAAHENLFAFNPGQDETTQRGRGGKQVRTLASYLMGCDDGSYARVDACDGYVAGVFAPTEGESCETFTAVMAMRGHLEKSGSVQQARLDDLFFAILPSEQLTLGHFVKNDSGGKYIVEIDRILSLLKKEFGASSVESYEKKGAYLQRLFAILKGKKSSVSSSEAKHAAKTFSGFMAYKPVRSIHDFVAQEILEPKDLGEAIRSVSDLMKTVHEMEANASRIKASVETLEQARNNSHDYIQLWSESVVARYSESSHKVWQLQKSYLDTKQKYNTNVSGIEELDNSIQFSIDKRQNLQQVIIQLEAKRQGIPTLRKKDELEACISRCQNQLASTQKPISLQIQRLHQNIDSATDFLQQIKSNTIGAEISELESKSLLQDSRGISQNTQAAELDAFQLFNQDWIDLSPLENTVQQTIDWQQQHNQWAAQFLDAEDGQSLKERVSALLERRRQQRKRLESESRKKQQEIQLLENMQVSYPHYVELAVKTISEQCPQADPKVLCDYVDILDARWQMAIEGYIGGARYSIIVDAQYEAEAIRIVRSMRSDRRSKARVIQGKKAEKDAQRSSVSKSSIIELMSFSHRTAQDYLTASYGSVIQVNDAEQLKMTARGITSDGLASGSYAMWRCDLNDADLVFGQAARQRALAAKEQEHQQLLAELHNAEADYQQVLRLNETIGRVQTIDLASLMQTILPLLREWHNAENALQDLDFTDSEDLESQLHSEKQALAEYEKSSDEFSKKLGGLQLEQKQLELRIKTLANEQESIGEQKDQDEAAVLQISSILPRYDAEAELRAADEKAKLADSNFTVSEHTIINLNKTERDLYTLIQQHNQTAESIDQLVYDSGIHQPHSLDFFKSIAKLSQVIESLHNRLKNNILVERHRQIEQLKDSFNTAFVTNLCHSIYQAINSGKNSLEDLNRELEHHRFGGDRERFYFGITWVPEYQEYWQFFKTIINMPNLGDGTTLFDVELSPKHQRTRDKLLSMLLDEDSDTAHRELNRISDYRNYRRYEIYKEPENKQPIALSQYGTGSGGQLETPAYIIRSAAVTSAFRFNEGTSHLRMVMVDEAFSKMDETRSREVIHYLTNSLGLQLIFIMPTSKSGPFMDIISNQFVFTKCPTQQPVGELKTRVLVDRKECNQEQIAKLWAKHRKTIRHQAMLDFMEDIK